MSDSYQVLRYKRPRTYNGSYNLDDYVFSCFIQITILVTEFLQFVIQYTDGKITRCNPRHEAKVCWNYMAIYEIN